MTARELFERLLIEGLADKPLLYPNWIYQEPTKHLAHVIDVFETDEGIELEIDVKEGLW